MVVHFLDNTQEAAVVVLDVGPHMTNYLPALKRSVFLLAETKVGPYLKQCIAASAAVVVLQLISIL